MSQYWYISHVVGKERLRCHSTGTFLMWLERGGLGCHSTGTFLMWLERGG